MKNKTIDALIELGIPANIKGFKYIVDTICLFAEDETWIYSKKMALYHKIAEINNDTQTRVERAIRNAFSIALNKGNWKAVNKYLTFQQESNGSLLATLYYRLKMED